MSDAEFDAFVASSVETLKHKQDALTDRYSLGTHARWDFDQTTQVLRFSDADGRVRVEASAISIGSFSTKSQSWQWAWSNKSIPEMSRSHSARLQGLFPVTGMEVFRRETFAADEAMAWELAAMAVDHLSAVGCYRGPAGHLHVFLAIESIQSVEGEA